MKIELGNYELSCKELEEMKGDGIEFVVEDGKIIVLIDEEEY